MSDHEDTWAITIFALAIALIALLLDHGLRAPITTRPVFYELPHGDVSRETLTNTGDN